MVKKLSKKFILEQKKRLNKEKHKALLEINRLYQDDPFKDPNYVLDNAAVDTDVREQIDHETIEAQIKDLKRRINDIEDALKKIEKGKYGLCEKCGNQIPLERLLIIPEASYCIECEKKLRK